MYTKVIMAHAGHGKTTRLAQIVYEKLKQGGKKVLFLSSELDRNSIYMLINSQSDRYLLSIRGSLDVSSPIKSPNMYRGLKYDVLAVDQPTEPWKIVEIANNVQAEEVYYTQQLNRDIDEVEFVRWDKDNDCIKVK